MHVNINILRLSMMMRGDRIRGNYEGNSAMATSIFDDKSRKPDEKMVSEAVGGAKKLWEELKSYCLDGYATVREEWKFYNSKSGWILTLREPKRVVLYMVPEKGGFSAGVTLSKEAVEAAMSSGLPEEVKEVVRASPQYPEGRSVRLDIRKKQDLESMKKLAAMRMGK